MGALMGAADEEVAEKMQGFFGKLFGAGGVMRAYMVAVDEHTVVTAYSQEQLTRLVAHLRVRHGGFGGRRPDQEDHGAYCPREANGRPTSVRKG